jgi:CMP-2-keto-3-deoxyoctulosonic acid synthetase
MASCRIPNVTKVVVDREGYAMYFSARADFLHPRPAAGGAGLGAPGLYVYTPRDAAPSSRGCRERRGGAGRSARTACARSSTASAQKVETTHATIGVDTREDLERVRALPSHLITT